MEIKQRKEFICAFSDHSLPKIFSVRKFTSNQSKYRKNKR